MDTTARRPCEILYIVVLALLVVAVCAGMGVRAVWDTDEGMHAAMSMEMLKGGDWLTPSFNGKPFHDKPVMFTWLVAISLSVFDSEAGARLPRFERSAFAALALLLVGVSSVFSFRVAPGMEPYRSARVIAGLLDDRLQSGADIYYVGGILGDGDSALFYTGRRGVKLRKPRDIHELFSSEERVFALVAGSNAWRLIGDCHVVERVGDKSVVSNRSDESDSSN